MQSFSIERVVNRKWPTQGCGGFHVFLIGTGSLRHKVEVTAAEIDKMTGGPMDDLFTAGEPEIRDRLNPHFDEETVDHIIKKLKVMPRAT